MTDWDAELASAYAEEPEPHQHDGPPVHEIPFVAPLNVVVVGSADWDEPLVVQAALLGWAQHHPDRSIILWTTGAPGAEATAVQFASAQGWTTSELPPHQLLDVDATVVFAFLTDDRTQSAQFVDVVASRRPVRVFHVESRLPATVWRGW